MKRSIEMFVITNKDSTKIVTDMAWRGLGLEAHSIEEILLNAKITDNEFYYEKSSDERNHIQYYKSYDKAEIVLNALHQRERDPILETLKIIKFEIKVELEGILIVESSKVQENKKMMEEFEAEISFIGKPEYFADDAKNSDYSTFKYAIVQDFYQSWKIRKGYTK